MAWAEPSIEDLRGMVLQSELGTIFANQAILVHFADNSYNLVTENAVITKVNQANFEPTIEVSVDALTIEALEESLTNNYKAIGFFNKLRINLLKKFFQLLKKEEKVSIPLQPIVEEPIEKVEPEEVVPQGPQTHTLDLVEEGFPVKEINIKVDDVIQWTNNRKGSFDQALIVGTRNCVRVNSGILKQGESFTWTFKEKGVCTLVDGIFTEETLQVVVN